MDQIETAQSQSTGTAKSLQSSDDHVVSRKPIPSSPSQLEPGPYTSTPMFVEINTQHTEPEIEDPLATLLRISDSLQSLPARLKPVEDQVYFYPSNREGSLDLCARMVRTAQDELRIFKGIVRSPQICGRLQGHGFYPVRASAAAAANYVRQINLWTRLLEDIVLSHDIYGYCDGNGDSLLAKSLPLAEEAIRVSTSRKAVQYLVILKPYDFVTVLREILQ